MTDPTPAADPAAVLAAAKTAIQQHARPALARIGRQNADVTAPAPAAVAALTFGPVVQTLTTHAPVAALLQGGVDPALRQRVDEYRLLFDNHMAFSNGMLAQCGDVMAACDRLADFEFMHATGHGKAALAARAALQDCVVRGLAAENALRRHAQSIPLARTDADFAKFDVFVREELVPLIEQTKQVMTKAGADFAGAVEFESIKALVVLDPGKQRKALQAGLWIIDQCANAMQFSGGLFGVVPSPFTTPVAVGLSNAATGIKVLMAFAGKAALSAQAAAAVKDYQANHQKGAQFAEHNADPTKMHRMLTEKHMANLEITLVCADGLIGVGTSFFSPLGLVWDVARKGITSAMQGYLGQRLALLQELLGKTQDTESVIVSFGTSLFEEFRGNIFTILNPLDALKGAVLDQLGTRIAEMIVERLPIDPAQPVNGSAMQAGVDSLAEAMIAGMPKVAVVQPPTPAATAAASRPTADNAGNPVQSILSGVKTDDQNREYRNVKIGGRTGALYADNGEFVPGPMDVVSEALMAVLPGSDAKGRPVAEVDLDTDFAPGAPGTEGADFKGRPLRVRVAGYWGFIDSAAPNAFWPMDVDPTGFADWSDREIKPDGYMQAGKLVKGRWHKPFPERSHLLFAAEDGTHHWAKPQDNTGNGKGAGATIASLATKVKDGYDLREL
ncbi:hypothetical protein UO65_3002 [Actinokineospora spheciospongiae]|uniref:Uncharacterized protein n=1 Tax=Actinokineospora spheciospongiae TaxID=909613 RepID=W7J6E6_9PSEU|nr:hypothetical protein [Actinokineospora spheciospongiae]EWC61644.1 hypothetical protein UO65_3002 [Actinokineospora spheciospongiae]PWW62300.1 hypothetical protein DFQ13_105110 [Actinokineospora spheciospongiae]